MRNIKLLALLLLMIQCEKDLEKETDQNAHSKELTILQDYIIAGDTSIGTKYFIGDSIENMYDGDTVPGDIWTTMNYFSYDDFPLNIDEDEELEIRFGAINYLMVKYLICRGLFVSNNYNNEKIEFVLLQNHVIGMNNDTVKLTKLFNKGDTISTKNFWFHGDNSKGKNLFYLSYYYDFESHKALSLYSGDTITGNEIMINQSVNDKFIGIRKKIGENYAYGWISCEFKDYDEFKLLYSMFALK